MSYFDAAAFARKGRVGQARWLAEAMRPYAEAVPSLHGYVESIRRFGAGEFVPRDELAKAAAHVSLGLQIIHLAEQGHLTPQEGPEAPGG